jgi:PAS domain S-box-containing protein
MKLKTQFILAMIFFGAILLIFAVTAIVIDKKEERLNKQAEIAVNIEQKANDLGYLGNEYLLYREGQQRKNWETKYNSFLADLQKLNLETPEVQSIINHIKINHKQLGSVFTGISLMFEGVPSKQRGLFSADIQASWGRLGIYSQDMEFDAQRLTEILHRQAERLTYIMYAMILALVGLFGMFLLFYYLLFYRRTIQSLSVMQAGTKVIGSGNLGYVIEDKHNDEISELACAFNRMTGNLKELTTSRESLQKEIAERNRAEEALRERNEQLSVVFNGVSETLLLMDITGNVLAANNLAIKRLNKGETDIIGKNIYDLIPDPFGQPRKNQVLEMIRTKKPVQFLDKLDDSLLEVNFYPVFDIGGNVVQLISSTLDITKRKQAEWELIRSREEWIETFNTIPDLISIIDNQHRIVRVNKAMADRLGVTPEQAVGLSCYNCVHGIDTPIPACPHSLLLQDGKEHVAEVHEVKLGGDFIVSVTPLRDKGGAVKASVHVARDITARKKTEEELTRIHTELKEQVIKAQASNNALRESRLAALNLMEDALHARKQTEAAVSELHKLNRTLKALSDSNQALMHVRDESEYLQKVCSIIIHVCGFKMVWIGFAEDDENKTVRPAECCGFEEGYLETLDITWADTERGRGPTGTAIRTGKMSMCKNMLTDPAFMPWREGALKRGYASSIVFPLMQGGKAFGAISIYSEDPDPFSEEEIKLLSELATDISNGIATLRLRAVDVESRKQIETLNEFLGRRANELIQANQELKAFSYSVSHDLRNPLNAINANMEVLSIEIGGGLTEDAKTALSFVRQSTERMAQVITDLMTLSGISRKEIRCEDVNASLVAETFLEELKAGSPQRVLRAAVQPGVTINADPGLFRLLLQNLIRNAWKFTSKKNYSVIEFGVRDHGGRRTYFLKDNGVGFDNKDSTRMFQPYERLHPEAEFKGSGIGLAIVKRIVEKHGGTIWAQGEKNKGAIFYFNLGKK